MRPGLKGGKGQRGSGCVEYSSRAKCLCDYALFHHVYIRAVPLPSFPVFLQVAFSG